MLLLVAGLVGAQTPEAPPAAAPDATAEVLDVSRIEEILRGDQEVMQGDLFSYDPAGRRDPFRSLLETLEPQEEVREERPPGLPGALIEELRLQGIIQTEGGIIAFVQGREGISYIIRPGTKLYNGEVKEILPNRVVFQQQVNDPKQLKPYTEVVRELAD
jgi:type IV pilus assembly protein PilP